MKKMSTGGAKKSTNPKQPAAEDKLAAGSGPAKEETYSGEKRDSIKGAGSSKSGWLVCWLPICKNCIAGDQLPGVSSKPSSAGSSNRDAAQRILQLCQKGEWPPAEQAIKNLEKVIASGGEDAGSTPLAGVSDVVSWSCGNEVPKR